MEKKLLLGVIALILIFSISNVYGLTPSNNQNEQTLQQIQNNKEVNQQTIPKEQAINIALRQLDLVTHPKLVTITVLGITKINGRNAWKISCKTKEWKGNYLIYVDIHDGKSKKNKKMWCDEQGETLWRSISEVTACNAALSSFTQTPYLKRPWKVKLQGQNVWKVPLYDNSYKKIFICYIYVNFEKKIARRSDKARWWTFKELQIE